jgi:hypothetical protein
MKFIKYILKGFLFVVVFVFVVTLGFMFLALIFSSLSQKSIYGMFVLPRWAGIIIVVLMCLWVFYKIGKGFSKDGK